MGSYARQALIGDESEAIHQAYVSVGFDALKKVANALPDLFTAS
jgi:hypothetical protein